MLTKIHIWHITLVELQTHVIFMSILKIVTYFLTSLIEKNSIRATKN